ncbi:hypothetical protein C7974DRAFT_55987 [Boeremia exigua]|uniref:uncharacterized protein n=1 Tax=Boeremia exigua TaxID=749465 RepID=UPI001E8E6156|nr:uncharacterized protein C7974DRAFT_55987 [Boeremia exigua]KAH6614912.1 hypothetical protein C7974DRAFT_55987 [Boeremia exigua]
MALWSRATRTPGSCRRAIASRAAAHHGPRGLRRPCRPPTSANVHTSSPAAAAAVDAQGPVSGRLWEAAIASLQEALERPLAQPLQLRGQAALESIPHTPLEGLPGDLDWARVARVAGMDLADDQRLFHRMHSRAYDDPHGAWEELRWDSRHPGMQQLQWPANTGHRVNPYNLPPQSLWAPDRARLTAMRRRHTWKKLAIQELSVAMLIHSLLHYIRTPRQPLPGLSPHIKFVIAFGPSQAIKARENIFGHYWRMQMRPVDTIVDDDVLADIYPNQPAVPRYHQDADGDFHQIAQRLNLNLKQLLHHDSQDRKDDNEAAVPLAKICHNLFVSSAPPDVQTFNILIAGFRRWRRPEMVEHVIRACLGSKIRPNEITLRYILSHYISENRADEFSEFVAWMRGATDTLMLATPDITINEASQGRLIRRGKMKVFQKVYPTPTVFDGLMGGVLKFAGFERALDVYYEMKSDGWGLDMAGLRRLLGDCIRRADWQGGVYVWAEIKSIQDTAKPLDMAKAYEYMLCLGSVTGNTSAFNQLLKEIANGGHDRHAIITRAIKRAKRTSLSPAWAADNLLIAVSGFAQDYQTPEQGATPELNIDDLIYGQPIVEGDDDMMVDNLSNWDDSTPVEVSEQKATDATETWASWVEAEFGERPKEPEAHDWLTAMTSAPVGAEPDPTASEEAWEKWLQAEFGEEPEEPKT